MFSPYCAALVNSFLISPLFLLFFLDRSVFADGLTLLDYSWTRDPFDRLIVGHAAVDDELLLSKDRKILENYPFARW